MSDYTLIHNPRCSKSRQTLELLIQNKIDPKIILYLEEELSPEFLKKTFKALDSSPKDCLRVNEEEYKTLAIDFENDRDVIEAIIKYPKILERPIFLSGDRARIGRPPERVLEII